MKKNKSKKMTALIVVLVIIALIVVWFLIPYSPVKSQFNSDVEVLKNTNRLNEDRVFEASDFETFPMPIQRYIENSGYIGLPLMSYMCMEHDL